MPAVSSLFSDLNGNGSCLRIAFDEEDFAVILLHATLVLINSCTIKRLQNIPRNLSATLVIHLKTLWEQVHRMMLCGTSLQCSSERHFYVSNITTNDLAESIFRLCMDNDTCGGSSNLEEIKRSIFCLGEINFEQFILDYWEVSPLLIRGSTKASLNQDDIFDSLSKPFQAKAMPSFLFSMLKNLTSCPPIASDELNILHFLEEVKDCFGCPIIYQQDIRVIKTYHSEGELHYSLWQSGPCSSQSCQFFHVNEIQKCEEAYNEGYTIAVRGMEFRFERIAAIAHGLASLFGQPSAGVNMYLTPPNSQGLSRHCDDHCVFVCQLMGVKEWKIFSRSGLQLPRLYEANDSLPVSEVEIQAMGRSKQFLLHEGDVLYIPRGFPHEARTTSNEGGSAGFSLHLTLAIEVEPPFEWEGFLHVALNHWSEKQREPQRPSSDSMSLSLHVTSVNLLHVAIKLIGDIDPIFRKASLVGQISLSTVTAGWLTMNQRTIFKKLICEINDESKFSDCLDYLETSVQKHEDPFLQLRWLEHLNGEGEVIESHKSNISSADVRDILYSCSQHKDIIETAFVQVKTKFCREALFEDIERSYKMLLEIYKKVRKQYTEGMLSLHLTGDEI